MFYNKVGDLYRALGQGEAAREAYQKSLQIRERLAAAEPDRADYQRDLFVSHWRLAKWRRAREILEAMKARNQLLPSDEPYLEQLRQMTSEEKAAEA